jgi:Transmembrane domain of unknown function (DUF3566)
MEEKTIQSIPIMPFALMYACISAVIGFLIGIFYAFMFGIIFASIPSTTSTPIPGWVSLFLGVGAIIIVPIIAFVSGLIMAIIIALLYNFLAPRIGGVKVRFKEESRPVQQQ